MDGTVYTHLRNRKMHRERLIDFLMIIQHSSRGNQQFQHTIWLGKMKLFSISAACKFSCSQVCNKASRPSSEKPFNFKKMYDCYV